MPRFTRRCGPLAAVLVLLALAAPSPAQEPPALNPFGPRTTARADAVPGSVEWSNGTVRPGLIHLTRDARLQVFDEQQKRLREVPLPAVARIDAEVRKEWLEREWRFRENASDVKVFTGRAYPVREYVHTITLRDGRSIRGPLQALVYLRPDASPEAPPERVLLHKRDKGPVGSSLEGLVYVRSIRLGDDARNEVRPSSPGARKS